MRKQHGLSLIELMIAVTLGLVLMTGVIQMFLSSRTVFSTQQGLSRIQESGRLAMEFMSRDIRMAGYMGCTNRASPVINNRLNNPNAFASDIDTGIVGYAEAPAGANLTPAPLAGTDLLVVRGATGTQAVLAAVNSTTEVVVVNTGSAAGACEGGVASLSGICPNNILVISDCVKSQIFQATTVGLSGGAGSNVVITHTTGNASPIWTGITYQAGAEVLIANNTVYYVANNPAGRPSLYQNLNGTSLELLEGVEDMRLTYSSLGSAATYVAAAAVGNWANVVSVRIELLIRSQDDSVLDEPQSFIFPTGTAARLPDPADRRMRQVFTSTVGIRSRLP